MGIGKYFSDAAKLLFMGVGISDAGTIPRKIDLSEINSDNGWRLLNCSASSREFKGREAVQLEPHAGEGLALYESLELPVGKVDLAIAGVSQLFGLIIHAQNERKYEVVKFEIAADNATQRLTMALRFGGQSTIVELSPNLIDEWLTARVVLERQFTAIFLNNNNTPSLKVPVQTSGTPDGKIGFWVGNQSHALVADLKYIQTRRRDFE